MPSYTWSRAALACAAILTLAIGIVLLQVPFEASEIMGNLLAMRVRPPAMQMVLDTFVSGAGEHTGFLRPFSYASSKFLFDVSGGHYFTVYRGFHIALIGALLLMHARLVRPASPLEFGLYIVSAAALIGMHPFHEAVRETELNIKLLIPVLCVGVLLLASSPPRRWHDALALVLTFYALFSNELGILLWVCLAAGWLVGFRGVSRGAVVAATVLLGLYFYLRFVQWDVGTPPLTERSSGWGFRTRDPAELIEMFGSNPLPFFAYNVVVSALAVLFSEPRSGAFIFVRDALQGTVAPGLALDVATSTATSAVVAWFAADRLRGWMRRDVGQYDRLFLVSVAIIAANAAISFPYAKDVTMSTGAVFYALAAFVALRAFAIAVSGRELRLPAALAVYLLMAALSLGWSVRGASLYADLRRAAYKAQIEWVFVREWMGGQGMAVHTPEAAEMIEDVRAEMLAFDVPKPYREPAWLRWLDPLH